MDDSADTREIPTATPWDAPPPPEARPARPPAPGWGQPPIPGAPVRRRNRLGLVLAIVSLLGMVGLAALLLVVWLAISASGSYGGPGLKGYVQYELEPGRGRHKILLVDVQGVIASGEGCAPLVVTQLRQLRLSGEPQDVRAVLLRVNSPGGTVTACDTIDNEVRKLLNDGAARADGIEAIPVLAFYDELAASGGYYVSARAKPIIARPTCLVGSIGVIGMSINAEKLLRDRLGIEAQAIKSRDATYKDVPSLFRPMTDDERGYVQKTIDDYHARFTGVIRDGRGLSDEQVRAFANGKVYLADDALALKMIDQVGDWDDALIEARKVAGPDAPVIAYRRRPSAFEMMLESRRGGSFVPEELRLRLELAASHRFCYLWLP